jgi:hypothetical protein
VSRATRTFERGAARATRLVGLVLLAGLVVTRRAAAAVGEGPTRVEIDATRCPSVSAAEIRRIVDIELGQPPPPAAELARPSAATSAAGDTALLSVICADAGTVVRVRAAGKAETAERPLPLQAFPGDAAPRALALAGIELLATMDATVRDRIEAARTTARPPPGLATPTTPTSRNVVSRTPVSSSPPSISFGAAIVRREFLRTAGLGGWGGRFDLVRDAGQRLRLLGDLEVVRASHPSDLGDAQAFLISAGVFAAARAVPATHVLWSIALGARAGLARLSGAPAQDSGAVASSVWRPWWGPAVSARVTLGDARLAGMASLEIGLTARSAEALAGTTTVLVLGGPWLSAAAGVQF